MLIQRDNPTGIDIKLAQLQKIVYNKLTECGWTGYESYDRVYLNPYHETPTLRPEVYIGNGNYKEIYYNDNNNAESYFIVEPVRTFEEKFETNIGYIFQVNLNKLYPTITHRADEEAHRDVFRGIQEALLSEDITSLATGISDTYQGLNVDQVRLDDMQPCHVFRFNLRIIHEFDCVC